MADDLDLSRRDFVQVGVTTVAALQSGGVSPLTAQADSGGFSGTTDDELQEVAVLEGPRSARPEPDSDFFTASNRRRVYYAYRYIDEVTKASWYITQDLDVWHPEPVGAADVTTADGEAHAVSIVSRNGGLYVRRYE